MHSSKYFEEWVYPQQWVHQVVTPFKVLACLLATFSPFVIDQICDDVSTHSRSIYECYVYLGDLDFVGFTLLNLHAATFNVATAHTYTSALSVYKFHTEIIHRQLLIHLNSQH